MRLTCRLPARLSRRRCRQRPPLLGAGRAFRPARGPGEGVTRSGAPGRAAAGGAPAARCPAPHPGAGQPPALRAGCGMILRALAGGGTRWALGHRAGAGQPRTWVCVSAASRECGQRRAPPPRPPPHVSTDVAQICPRTHRLLLRTDTRPSPPGAGAKWEQASGLTPGPALSQG